MKNQSTPYKQLQTDLLSRQLTLQNQFSDMTAGLSQCEVGKLCPDDLGIKETEGRMQAVTDLLRCLNNHTDTQDIALCLSGVKKRWQSLSEISETWVTYKMAGLDEITKMTSRLD